MLTFNATGFVTWYNEFQAQAFNGSAFSVTNAGSLRSLGFEADGILAPHPTTQIGVALGFNPTQYLDFENSPCTAEQDWTINSATPSVRQPCTQNLSGRRLDNAPRWSTSIFANYERPVGTVPRIDLPVLGYFHGDWSYQSDIFLQQDLDQNLVQPGYGQLNLRTGLKSEDGHWELAFGVRNATNTAFNVVGFDVPIVNGFAVINGAPRTFYGSIRYRY
jgi:iron complex outermembrane receptor protein